MKMAYVTVHFNGRKVGLVREDINVSELASMFCVKPAGAHLKVRNENYWPDFDGQFSLPYDCVSAVLVAMAREDHQEEHSVGTSRPSTTPNVHFGRRGNSAVKGFFGGCSSSYVGVSTASSSFHVMARGHKSALASRGHGLGSRPVPSTYSMGQGKGAKKRKSIDTKSCRLTYVNDDGGFEDMWDIPIELSQLQHNFGLYTVQHVVAEVEHQLAEENARLVITDIKGNPIRDMVTTRGK